jgi:hypothetical protein
VSESYSRHAEKLIRSFRRGIYVPHIDFYVSHVGDWISSQLDARRQASSTNDVEPFLSYIILDMPGCAKQIQKAASVMRDGAMLVVFVPSVTQVGDCIREINKHRLPLEMEKVVELGEGISNGRLWDVRLAKIRAREKAPMVKVEADIESSEGSPDLSSTEPESVEEDAHTMVLKEDDNAPVLVCRPKVGRVIIGGGFVGVWRKIETQNTTEH